MAGSHSVLRALVMAAVSGPGARERRQQENQGATRETHKACSDKRLAPPKDDEEHNEGYGGCSP
jgi:hypothetical protein